jgi:hypothetical protein
MAEIDSPIERPVQSLLDQLIVKAAENFWREASYVYQGHSEPNNEYVAADTAIAELDKPISEIFLTITRETQIKPNQLRWDAADQQDWTKFFRDASGEILAKELRTRYPEIEEESSLRANLLD